MEKLKQNVINHYFFYFLGCIRSMYTIVCSFSPVRIAFAHNLAFGEPSSVDIGNVSKILSILK